MAALSRLAIEVALEESDTLELEVADAHELGDYDCFCCCPCHGRTEVEDY